MPPSRIRRILRIVHRVWITAGALFFVVFTTWALLAYRASALAYTALEVDARVTVTDRDTHWSFLPGSQDLTGAFRAWIEIGSPDAARLHKACKASPRVAVYTHKDPDKLLANLEGERIHRGDALEVYAMDRGLVSGLCARLDRRMAFALSITDRELYVSIGGAALTGAARRVR